MQLSNEQRDRIMRLISRTGEEYPLGGDVATPCRTLAATTVTPAIRELAGVVCDLESKVALLEKRIDQVTNIVKFGSVYLRLIQRAAIGTLPISSYDFDMTQNPTFYLYYWEPTERLWFSAESWTVCAGKSGNNISGLLSFTGNSPVTTPHTLNGVEGLYLPFPAAMVTWSGSNTRTPATGPTNVVIDILSIGAVVYGFPWPDNEAEWAASMSGSLLRPGGTPGWQGSIEFQTRGNPYLGAPVLTNNPKIFSTWKGVVDDGVMP